MPYRVRPAASKMSVPAKPETAVGGIDIHQERA
jgi:hypothetical protein